MAKANINPEFTYKTRDGQEVTDIKVGQPTISALYCVVAEIEGVKKYFTRQGYFYKGEIHHLDLIKQPAKKTKPAKENEVIQDITKVVHQNIPHKHYDLIVAWAKNPKLIIQLKDIYGNWIDTKEPCWAEIIEYRIKPEEPKLLTIIGADGKARSYPEPCRVKILRNQQYFVPCLTTSGKVDTPSWNNDHMDNCWLERGLVHLTEEAAELHAKAMLGVD